MNHKILIVDDEAANLRLLERLFRREYQVVSATSGAEALELLQTHDVALIISDQRMPGMTGIEFLKRAAEMRPHTVRIILTGYTDVNSLVEAINSGVVYKYVTKPWDNEDLRQTALRAVEHYKTNRRQNELNVQNERLQAHLKTANQSLIRFVANTIYLKDESLHEHLRRTSNYAVAAGHRLELDDAELKELSLAAFLHEVGRLSFSDESDAALAANGKNSFVGRAVQMLASVPELNNIVPAIRYQGRRFDGGGAATSGEDSPEAVSGERIPLFARIIAVADEYDLMTAPPFAEKALSHDEAIEKLRGEGGRRFDPRVVEAFCQLTAIGRIRSAVAEGSIGMCLLPSRILGGTDDLSNAELLQKIKTEPMLAMDVLKAANLASGSEKTAQFVPAMSRLGEERLRLLVHQKGLSSLDDKTNANSELALRRAFAAQFLARHTENIIDPDEAYTLGLLYDAGETLLRGIFPNQMAALENLDEDARRTSQIATFGIETAQISRLMLEACNLPRRLTAAVGTHQEEFRLNDPIAHLIYLADKIAKSKDSDRFAFVEEYGAEALATINLNRADFRAVCSRASLVVEEQINRRQGVYALV